MPNLHDVIIICALSSPPTCVYKSRCGDCDVCIGDKSEPVNGCTYAREHKLKEEDE